MKRQTSLKLEDMKSCQRQIRLGGLEKKHRFSSFSSFRFQVFISLVALAVAGCSSERRLGTWEGPDAPPAVTVSDWSYRGQPGKRLASPNYLIHTTIQDPELTASVARLMEGALAQYRRMAPGVPPTDRPMECFIFASRNQWVEFTRQATGVDAAVYLQIIRGGYAVRDWFVAYFLGDMGTYSVAAHEGWHQFVSRHFKGRLPPFLEEGIACMFENVSWSGGNPRWNLSINAARTLALRTAIEGKDLWPLEQLITMHAGQVVNQSGERIEAFYAQNWAFARFLNEAENGRFRPALQRLLADTANGIVRDPTGTHQRFARPWNPRGVRPMLEHYLGMPMAEIDSAYQAYIRKVAYDEFKAQWQLEP